MAGKTLVHDGSSKRIYETDAKDELILEFKTDIVVPESNRKKKIKHKAEVNHDLCVLLFQYLDSYSLSNHFLVNSGSTEIKVQKLNLLPLKIKVFNYTTEDYAKKSNAKIGKLLSVPEIKMYKKSENRDLKEISEEMIVEEKLLNKDELYLLKKMSNKINVILRSFFERRFLTLAQLELEFGKKKGEFILADELTLETCRIWQMTEKGVPDVSYFNYQIENLENTYKEIYKRFFGKEIE